MELPERKQNLLASMFVKNFISSESDDRNSLQVEREPMRDNAYVRAAITILTVLVIFVFAGCVSKKDVTGDSVSTESTDYSVESSKYSSESVDIDDGSTDTFSENSDDQPDTSFEKNRSYRSTYSEDDDLTESKEYKSYSDQTEWSSGYSATNNVDSLNNDPDDYDTPEDYADDAWGDDFDDWDDAYEYWEDNY